MAECAAVRSEPFSQFQCIQRIAPQLIVVLSLVALRLVAYFSAGGLWRDEVHSVNMATLPIDDLFFVLTNDSIPMCWQSLLRTWVFLFGSSDAAVRSLGLVIGLTTIPAIWWSMRQFGISFPWWVLVLFGLDPSLMIFGGEVRGYGLGIITFFLLVGTAWRTLQQPSGWQWCGLVVISLMAVQSSFTNCFLLAATLIACGVVALRQGRFSLCVGMMLVGILAAMSMVPYAIYVAPRLTRVVNLVHDPVPRLLPLRVFIQTYKWGGLVRGWLGVAVGLLGFSELLRQLFLAKRDQVTASTPNQDLVVFLPVFFWVGTAGFWFYMRFLGVQTANWYHLPWMALLAITTELGMRLWSQQQPERQRLTMRVATMGALLIAIEVVPQLQFRLTTTDLIARDLSQNVRLGDLVIVSPWYVGITFGRYYQGAAEWTNLPNVDHIDHHLAYEQQKEKVMPWPSPQGIQQELQKIDATLQAGGRVWWVGPFKLLPPGKSPLILSGAPDPQYGWSESAYLTSWQQIAIAKMQSIGVTVRPWAMPRPKGVNPNENPAVFLVERSTSPALPVASFNSETRKE
jgi:hypothetical protein